MSYFLNVEGLAELEKDMKWDAAKELLHDLWSRDKGNVNKLCRLIAECWLILTEWDSSIQQTELPFNSYKETLIEATCYGLEQHSAEPGFLWMVGYMISLFPYLFYEEGNDCSYSVWEKRGVEMLRIATQMEADNLVSKVLYLGTQGFSDEYALTRKLLAQQLCSVFPGITMIESYFREVLSS